MSNKHVNVAICTPGANLNKDYLRSLLNTINFLNNNGITWAYSNDYSSHVADSREITLAGTRINDYDNNLPFSGNLSYDKIFWIDSDIAWEPEDFMKLYESDKDIISGAYLSSSAQVMAYKHLLYPPFEFQEFLEKSGVIEVEGVGFGFIAIKNGVFESLSKPWFQQAYVKRMQEDGSLRDYAILGEDLSFCARALEKGFTIHVDTDVRLIHYKEMKMTWEGVRP
jgi:GT2 family glycosyltransferase